MIIEGADVCPLVKIGDEVKGLKVIDIICDRDFAATCRANKTLALLRLDDPYKEWHIISPTEVDVVDCNSCPVLAVDPDHFDKTWWLEALMIATGEPRSSLVTVGRPKNLPATSTELPKDVEPEPEKHDRFELIDISKEEESDASSSSDTNE